MPLSNDNQDYSEKENKDKKQPEVPGSSQESPGKENQMTSDDLKGKQQVDGDIEKESDRPASV
jgi:hypothetical protein